MSILATATNGKRPRPRRTVLYGTHGIGKTTWGAAWPSPLILPTEDGNADIDCAALPLIVDPAEVWEAARELSNPTEPHPFKTAVLDSADWLERLIWKRLCHDEDKNSIEDFGFGKGHTKTAEKLAPILSAFNGCRDAGLHVVILAHCEIRKVEKPTGESYGCYQPKLNKASAALLQEWADEVLFADYEIMTRTKDEGFNKTREIAIGEGERVIMTTERPGWLAKNRLGLPHKMPMNFAEYAKYLPPISAPGNVPGAVVNGSSKGGGTDATNAAKTEA